MTSLVFQGEKAASREFTTCPFIRKATCQLIPIFPSPGYQMHINESIPGTRRTLVVVRARRVTARERAWCSGCSETGEQNIFQSKTNVDRLPALNRTAQEFKKSFSSDNNHGLNISVAFDIVPSLTSDSPAGSTLGCSHLTAMPSKAQPAERISLCSRESKKGSCSFGTGASTSSTSLGFFREGSLPPHFLLANLLKSLFLPVTLQVVRRQIIKSLAIQLRTGNDCAHGAEIQQGSGKS